MPSRGGGEMRMPCAGCGGDSGAKAANAVVRVTARAEAGWRASVLGGALMLTAFLVSAVPKASCAREIRFERSFTQEMSTPEPVRALLSCSVVHLPYLI